MVSNQGQLELKLLDLMRLMPTLDDLDMKMNGGHWIVLWIIVCVFGL